MIAIGANLRSGNPIVGAWMKGDGQYAFLEFRTPEEANNAFKLDGICILDKVILISKIRVLKLEGLNMELTIKVHSYRVT